MNTSGESQGLVSSIIWHVDWEAARDRTTNQCYILGSGVCLCVKVLYNLLLFINNNKNIVIVQV